MSTAQNLQQCMEHLGKPFGYSQSGGGAGNSNFPRKRLVNDQWCIGCYISHIENGQKSPTLRVIERLAGALRMNVSGLMELAEQIQGEDAEDCNSKACAE